MVTEQDIISWKTAVIFFYRCQSMRFFVEKLLCRFLEKKICYYLKLDTLSHHDGITVELRLCKEAWNKLGNRTELITK